MRPETMIGKFSRVEGRKNKIIIVIWWAYYCFFYKKLFWYLFAKNYHLISRRQLIVLLSHGRGGHSATYVKSQQTAEISWHDGTWRACARRSAWRLSASRFFTRWMICRLPFLSQTLSSWCLRKSLTCENLFEKFTF